MLLCCDEVSFFKCYSSDICSFKIASFWTLLNPCNILSWLHCNLRWWRRGWSHHWSYGRYFLWARPHWIVLLGPMCWISHFGPDRHEMRVISLIRAFVGSRLWGPLEWYKCWAIDGQKVIVFVRTVTADFFWFWLASTECFLFATMKNLTTKP